MRIADPDSAVPVDWRFKGVAAAHDGRTADDLGDAGVHLFDDSLHFPVAVLRDDVVAANSRWMRDFIQLAGVAFAQAPAPVLNPSKVVYQVSPDHAQVTRYELGFFLVSTGGGTPHKVHVRSPSFVHMGGVHRMLDGYQLADVVTTFGSVNMIGGECDR